MKDLGVFIKHWLAVMKGVNRENLLQLSASALVRLLDNISEVDAEQTEDNQAHLNAAAAVLLYQRVKIFPRDFSNILQCHRQHLEYIYSAVHIEVVEREHEALCDLYHRDLNVKAFIDSLNDDEFFDSAWTGLTARTCFSWNLSERNIYLFRYI